MNNPELLAIYLRDHHATAHGALEMCRRSIKSNADNVFAQRLEELTGELERDRDSLEAIMEALDVDPSRLKEAGAWLTEKVGRLKLNGHVTSYSPLSRVVELEGLVIATQGRICLWRSLQLARQSDQRLAPFDFQRLIERAEEQREELDALRRQAVEIAFVEGGQA